jgi:hypothetical protein
VVGVIGLTAIALTEFIPALQWLWYALTFAGLLAWFWWRGESWLRDDLPDGAIFGAPPAGASRTAWLILVIALVFQLARWRAEDGAIRTRTGDDDESYIFLAYQILGYFDAPPVFALRSPGWPLIIAGWLSLFGHRAIWSIALYHRLLLASFPPILYLILARFMRRPPATAAALLSLAMEYNEVIASTGLGDLSYTAAGLFGLYGLIKAQESERPYAWMLGVGSLFALRTAIRLTGFPVAIAAAAAWIVVTRQRWQRVPPVSGDLGRPHPPPLQGGQRPIAGQVAVLFAPIVLVLLGISAYNQAISGHFTPSSGAGITFLTQYVPFMSHTPDTPAVREAAELFPDVPPERLFSGSGQPWIGQYRYTASGLGDPFDYGDLTSQVMREVVLAAPGEYLIRAGEGALIMLLDPHRHILPQSWYVWPEAAKFEAPDDLQFPEAACNLQLAFGAVFKTAWCTQHDQLRDSLYFQPPWLARFPAWLKSGLALITVSLPYRVRHLMWPLYGGLGAFASLIYLMTRPETRRLSILLMLPMLAEFALILSVTNGVETRYLFYFHPTYLIATWLALSVIVEFNPLRGRQNHDE